MLNLDKYEDSIKKIKDNCTWEGVVDDSKSELKGVITSRGGYVMLTIPYDEGLIIKVDGKKVKYREV